MVLGVLNKASSLFFIPNPRGIMKPVSLTEHKNKKKFKKIVEDIDSILRVISLTQKSLSFYKQYIPVQEMISILATNSTLLELYRKSYADKLEELNKNDEV